MSSMPIARDSYELDSRGAVLLIISSHHLQGEAGPNMGQLFNTTTPRESD